MNILKPRERERSILDVDYARLYRDGKRALLFDLDNTLGKHRPERLAPEVTSLLADLTSMGFSIGILTNRRNANGDRVIKNLSSKYPVRHRARKPAKNGFLDILSQIGISCDRAVMIGDRRLTDIFGANRLGIYSIHIRR